MIQLSAMRNRISAIQTIQKITHAMRLIAMSTHTNLQQRIHNVGIYHAELTNLFSQLETMAPPTWKPTLLMPASELPERKLVILVGSQKGLCGPFNTGLFRFFENHYTMDTHQPVEYIAIGKRAVDYLSKKVKLTHSFDSFGLSSIEPIAHVLSNLIMTASPAYTQVICYANAAKSFFVQKPQECIIIPHTTPERLHAPDQSMSDFLWEQPLEDILNHMAQLYLGITIEYTLTQSLVSEQSARFQSMDQATTNARDMLEDMQRQYNKARQEKITRELTELAGGLLALR